MRGTSHNIDFTFLNELDYESQAIAKIILGRAELKDFCLARTNAEPGTYFCELYDFNDVDKKRIKGHLDTLNLMQVEKFFNACTLVCLTYFDSEKIRVEYFVFLLRIATGCLQKSMNTPGSELYRQNVTKHPIFANWAKRASDRVSVAFSKQERSGPFKFLWVGLFHLGLIEALNAIAVCNHEQRH